MSQQATAQEPATNADPTVLATEFREVIPDVATPVSVVTSMGDGLLHGTPVRTLASLSMDPPMVLVSLDRGSDLLTRVRETGRSGVNVLGADRARLTLALAKRGGTGEFSGVHGDADHELPRLPWAQGWPACDVAQLVDGGDHVVSLGSVIAAETAEGRPLTYHGGLLGTHALHEEEA